MRPDEEISPFENIEKRLIFYKDYVSVMAVDET